MNLGDFLDDYVCIDSGGDLRVGLNSGLDDGGTVYFKEVAFSSPTHAGTRYVRLG
jgi:hypothetical protein